MAAAEWSKYGNAGGWQLPPKKQANQQRGMMPDYFNQLDQGRAARSGGGMNYNNVIPTREQWESFSEPNKQRAIVMTQAGRQGNVPMGKLKELIDSNAAMSQQRGQFSSPGKLTYGQGTGGYNPGYTGGFGAGNYQAAIKANQNANTGYTESMMNDFTSAIPKDLGFGITGGDTGGGGGAWYDDLWQDAKDLGIKGWGEIGIGAMNAYTGWQETEMAKKQHGLAQETFDFQKAAYNKDREGRVLAYNTNAQNVNAWKEAQGRTDLNKLMV